MRYKNNNKRMDVADLFITCPITDAGDWQQKSE